MSTFSSIFGDTKDLPDAVGIKEISKPKYQSAIATIEKPVEQKETTPIDTANSIPPKTTPLEEKFSDDDFDIPEEEMEDWLDKYEAEVETLTEKTNTKATDEKEEEIPTAEDSFWTDLLGDADSLWEMWVDTREALHGLLFDYVVENPNGLTQLRTLRQELIDKTDKSSEEKEALSNLNRYLDEVADSRKNYFDKLQYHRLQEKWGKRYLTLKLKEIQVKGEIPKWLVPVVVFGLAEFNATRRMIKVKKSIPNRYGVD